VAEVPATHGERVVEFGRGDASRSGGRQGLDRRWREILRLSSAQRAHRTAPRTSASWSRWTFPCWNGSSGWS